MVKTDRRHERRKTMRRFARYAESLGVSLADAVEQVGELSPEEQAQILNSVQAKRPSSRHYRKGHRDHCPLLK